MTGDLDISESRFIDASFWRFIWQRSGTVNAEESLALVEELTGIPNKIRDILKPCNPVCKALA